MKIKTVASSYDEVMAKNPRKLKAPKKPNILFRTLVRIASIPDLWKARVKKNGSIDKKGGPYFILMNHSSFIDLEVASKLLYPMPYNIVTTLDGLVGKRWLMNEIGCISTRKFVSDITLIHEIQHALKRNTSVLMYPEAGYSLDGTSTTLPRHLGMLLKKLDVPVVFIEAKGAFLRDPLYNCLQVRDVDVSADIRVLFTQQEVRTLPIEELDRGIDEAFSFDYFRWQKENGVIIDEPFRADGLERILYRCPACHAEGKMEGHGTTLTCYACKKTYKMTELGELIAEEGETEFSHIPDWYAWQRECVRQELLDETYSLDTPVEIAMMIDDTALYTVGKGRLTHDLEGFHLTSEDGKIDYRHKALSSYSLNSDYYWYEMGDVIGIGNMHVLYYCFPPKEVSVAKARLATEELFKLHQIREYHKAHHHN